MSADSKKTIGIISIIVVVAIALGGWAWGLRVGDIQKLDARDQDQEIRLRRIENTQAALVPEVQSVNKKVDRILHYMGVPE